MSNKGTYAAVVANGSSSKPDDPPVEAPPPYSGPSQPQPQTHVPASLPRPADTESAGLISEVTRLQQARSRALRRFWGAMLWAWIIWILAGLIIGGGISDVQNAPVGRHGHWDKHGRWKADKTYTYISDDGKVTRTWRRKEGPTAVAVRWDAGEETEWLGQ